MTNLTPEAVKAALEGATPGPWVAPYETWDNGWSIETDGENSAVGIGVDCKDENRPIAITAVEQAFGADHIVDANADLIAMAPALARDWLRLKKVEEAGKELDAVIRTAARKAQAGQVNTAIEWLLSSVRELDAFRAAVEGK
jgi:hypothetical protein